MEKKESERQHSDTFHVAKINCTQLGSEDLEDKDDNGYDEDDIKGNDDIQDVFQPQMGQIENSPP
eukprot:scaffold166250_cov39-Attheya_sp.AAC.2